MAKLEVEKLVKRFGAHTVLRGVSFRVQEGDFVVLLGPSGCGKTTTLRLLAGLLEPDGGVIRVDGRELAGPGWGVPPERRNMAMVFQSYAIWPHKTVFENVAYGLRLRGIKGQDLHRRVYNALELVQLQDYASRYPSELSGGQQQRVALARAIVVEPAILLLDEPLSNLDAILREEMRFELKELQRQLGITSVYVTHDQAEAMVLADHLIVMRDGAIEQQGRPESVYLRPATRFVAGFLGATNLVEGRVAHLSGDLACLESEVGSIWAHLPPNNRGALAPGARAWVSVRPIEVTVSSSPPQEENVNCLPGHVVTRSFLGELVEYQVQTNEVRWKVRTHPSEQFQPGEQVWIGFSYDAGTVVPDTSQG